MNILDPLKSTAFANPATLQGAVVYAVVFGFFAWVLSRMLRVAVHRALARDSRLHVDRTTVRFLAQLAQIGIYIFVFISYARLVPALADLGTTWLTSVSVISVVVGLAAQNTLGNLIAGISLVLYRPFNLGDRLQVSAPTGLETGLVENLTLGYTLLKTDDNRRVVVPNSIMASQTTINLTRDDPRLICSIPIVISYDSDLDKARAILLELAEGHPKAEKLCGCPVTQLDGFGVVLTLSAWCADSVAAGELKNDLLEKIKKRFATEGIRIPLVEKAILIKH